VVTFNEIWAFHMGKYSRCEDPPVGTYDCLTLNTGNWGMLAFVDGHVKYTESIGANANKNAHDWRTTYYNEKADDLGKNTYDIR
jgi:prepilin-type processing-associated H-X9-DG protein